MPNSITLPKLTDEQIAAGWKHGAENIDDVDARHSNGEGHGTCIASIAGGKSFGVARNASLYLIKWKNEYFDGTQNKWITGNLELAALEDAMKHVYDQVTKGGIPPHRSVVQVAYGKD